MSTKIQRNATGSSSSTTQKLWLYSTIYLALYQLTLFNKQSVYLVHRTGKTFFIETNRLRRKRNISKVKLCFKKIEDWNQVIQDCKHVLQRWRKSLLERLQHSLLHCSQNISPRITTSPRPAAHHSSADDPAPDKPNLLPHCVPLNWSIHRPRLTDQSPAVRIGPYKYRISERNQFFVERSSWQARELRASRWTALNYTSRHLPKPADRRSIGYLIHIVCGWARAACIALNIGLRSGSAIAGVFIYGINLNSFLREGRRGKVR